MNITIAEIGRRLKEVRCYYNFKQKDIAKKIGVPQNMVSRLESGRAIGSEKLLLFLCFYSKYIYIDRLFDKNFDLIESNDIFSKDIHLESIYFEKIRLLKEKVKEYSLSIDEDFDDLLKFSQNKKK